MKIQRTIPPAAAPLYWIDLWHGLLGIFFAKRYIKRLEEEMKQYFGIKYVFPVSSGKAALTSILQSLKSLSPDKKEVLIPAYTCFSIPSAIVKAGLRVALCDIDPLTFDFDYKLLSSSINENTLCVVPNHLFGIPADMDRILHLCKDKGVYVVEDAAQAMGEDFRGKKLGTHGDVGFFSLGRGKNITCGSGGIIVTNSKPISDTISRLYANLKEPGIMEDLKELFKMMLMTIFIHPNFYWFPAGIPFLSLGQTVFYKDFPIKRLSGTKGGFLLTWQDRLDQSIETKVKAAAFFKKWLRLKVIRDISIPYPRLPILMNSREERDNVYALSQKRGLGISLMYPKAINEIEELRVAFNGKVFPAAKETAERLLTIPTHHFLSERDRKGIYELFRGKR